MLLGLHDVRLGPWVAKANERFGLRCDDYIFGMCTVLQGFQNRQWNKLRGYS